MNSKLGNQRSKSNVTNSINATGSTKNQDFNDDS